jgi:hypothetical protein
LAGALALALLGIVASVAVLAATGAPDPWGTALALALLLLGFAGLAVARTPASPWRPVRLALSIVVLLSLFLAASLPWPPASGAERQSAIVLTLVLVGSLLASVSLSRAPRFAVALLVALAAYGCVYMGRLVRAAAAAAAGASYASPAIVLSMALAGSLCAASIAALWHARSIISIAYAGLRQREG